MTEALSEQPKPAAALDRFRRAILAEPDLQAGLFALAEDDRFIARCLEEAAGRGLSLAASDFASLLQAVTPHPQHGFPGMLALDAAPPSLWLPVAVVVHQDALGLEWLPIGADDLQRSFFEQSIAENAQRPFARMMRCVTPLAALDTFAEAPGPSGFIYHMSRCGSTLVAQMLAAVPEFVSISEAPVIDTMIQLACRGLVNDGQLRNLVAALTRDRSGATTHRFVKLDSWHALALPRLRRAFPRTPWVFLYRNAMEVLISQRRRPGLPVIPGQVPLEVFGLVGSDAVAADDYPAWALTRYCAAALAERGDPLGRFVPYTALPDAVAKTVLPHFGVAANEAQLRRMAAVSRRNSKQPAQPFTADSASKQEEAAQREITAQERRLAAMVEAIDAAATAARRPQQSSPVRLGYDW